MYAVGVIIGSMSTNLRLDADLSNKKIGMVGMMPVFDTKEAALKEYPNNDIIELQGKEKK